MTGFPRLWEYPYIAYDTETTGLHWWQDKVFGVSVSAPDGQDWYWDIRREPKALDFLRSAIPRCQLVVAHHAKFDWHMSREMGVIFPEGRVHCSMIRAALLDEHRLTYDLDALGKDCCGIGKDTAIYEELAKLFGGKATKHAQAQNLHRAPVALVARYAKQDSRTGLKLWEWQRPEIEAQGLQRVHEVEMRLLAAIVRMEHGGVRIDVDRAERAATELDKRTGVLQRDLDRAAGFPVNPNPSGSIHKLFEPKLNEQGIWIANDGTPLEKTDAGKASIDADALRKLKHPCAPMILNLRKMVKARDTFLRGHVLGHHHNGYIHANYNQTKSDNDGDAQGTGTGRLSVNDPALQQIPARDKDMAAIVRAVFIPDEGHDWVCNDWAQMDFRVFAHYVNNLAILERYRADHDTDFHALAADLTSLPRSPRFAGDPNAKQINLGLIFGMGQGRLAQEMGLPYTVEPNGRGGTWIKPGPEAEAVFAKYHAAIPGVKDLLSDATSVAKSRGYVKTIIGRHIRFPRKMYTHKAGGLIFQGSAAEALKQKIIELDDYFLSLPERMHDSGRIRLLMNVHDEFDCTVPPHASEVRDEISRIVTAFGQDDVIHFRVPITTDQGVGPDWFEASK